MIIPRIKYFASRDYEGLNEEGVTYLRRKRDKLAKKLNKARANLRKQLDGDLSDVKTLRFNNRIDTDKGAKGIKLSTKVTTNVRGGLTNAEKASKHLKNTTKSLLISSDMVASKFRADAASKFDGKLENMFGSGTLGFNSKFANGSKYKNQVVDLRELPVSAEQKRLERSVNKGFKDPLLVNKETRLNRLKKLKDSRASYNRHSEIAEKLRTKKALGKKLKKAGYVGLGVAGVAGLAYGGKKLYDKYKKDDNTKD